MGFKEVDGWVLQMFIRNAVHRNNFNMPILRRVCVTRKTNRWDMPRTWDYCGVHGGLSGLLDCEA
jgi:hypothetical protein